MIFRKYHGWESEHLELHSSCAMHEFCELHMTRNLPECLGLCLQSRVNDTCLVPVASDEEISIWCRVPIEFKIMSLFLIRSFHRHILCHILISLKIREEPLFFKVYFRPMRDGKFQKVWFLPSPTLNVPPDPSAEVAGSRIFSIILNMIWHKIRHNIIMVCFQ